MHGVLGEREPRDLHRVRHHRAVDDVSYDIDHLRPVSGSVHRAQLLDVRVHVGVRLLTFGTRPSRVHASIRKSGSRLDPTARLGHFENLEAQSPQFVRVKELTQEQVPFIGEALAQLYRIAKGII